MNRLNIENTLNNIFEEYKKKYNLDNTILIIQNRNSKYHFITGFYKYSACNMIKLNLVQIKELKTNIDILKRLNKKLISFKELVLFALLHEIKHNIDYNNNPKLYKELINIEKIYFETNPNNKVYFENYKNCPLEYKADKFAVKEMQKHIEKLK